MSVEVRKKNGTSVIRTNEKKMPYFYGLLYTPVDEIRPRPPCSVYCIRIYGHGVGFSLFGLGGPINSKICQLGPVRNLVSHGCALRIRTPTISRAYSIFPTEFQNMHSDTKLTATNATDVNTQANSVPPQPEASGRSPGPGLRQKS